MKGKQKRFGFDLDNTLIDYSNSVREYCSKNELGDISSVGELRSTLRTSDPSGRLWTIAQGWLYTDGLAHAKPTNGAVELCEYLMRSDFELFIVSHKTTHSPDFCGRKPLHDKATNWITHGDLATFFLGAQKIYYEPTRVKKVERIKKMNFDYFVDDLIEVFEEPGYPKNVESFLLSEEGAEIPGVQRVHSLLMIQEFIEDER